jgi:sugar/nucleoside kinase (ribokinase family)
MSSLSHRTADLLTSRETALRDLGVVAGFDGFVDTIIHVVGTRTSAAEYERMTEMREFAGRIHEARGLSANFEFVTQMVKLGGNGPIFSAALAALGPRMSYIGCLGRPHVHAVFEQFADVAEVIGISEPGYTDAIEFDDGKLMCGKHAGLNEVTWARILEHVPLEQLVARFEASTLAALVNWTMLVHLSEIFENLLVSVAPHLTGPRRWVFFDLADPAKRTTDDLRRALHLIARFEKYFRVILGLNLQEARQVGEVLGVEPAKDDSPAEVTALAARIREAMDVENVVVHPTAFAAAADRETSCHVAGPFTPRPKITTGAGDHFNAGFCLGRLAGATLEESLQSGVGTSGYYVRNAGSPNLRELTGFLREL